MRKLFFIAFLLLSLALHAGDPIAVGIFQGANYSRITVTIAQGSYGIECAGEEIESLLAGQSADVFVSGGKLSFAVKGKEYTCASKVHFRAKGSAEFKIQAAGHKANGRFFPDHLSIAVSNGRLKLVNHLDVEKYIPGVIEAEGGGNHEMEYYKVQAVISRTYALNNLRRHEAEGFHVCDGTHCQVYHGRPRHEQRTYKAARETEDIVIVDQGIDLITAAFHSNCGGHTVNSEHVWSKPLSYCVGRPDTFCLVMPNSNWEKSISKIQWQDYLESKRYPLSDSTSAASLAFFPSEKQVFFVDSTFGIPMRTMRSDLKLKSAYFSVHQNGEKVTFVGQGFGHGVGLCQEGAMRMAVLGYSYQDIIHFYYKDVHLVPKKMLWFFKQE
jgi:stage II sporulation protein D